MSKSKNPIIQKSYYCFCVELASPLCIASSESSFTDADVLRNGNGECFVPGTSLAGAFRNTLDCAFRLDANERKNDDRASQNTLDCASKDSRSSFTVVEHAMGGRQNDADYLNDRMSKVWISDLNFCSDYTVSERDGVQLTDDHTVDNKFDMQIIETGARGVFYMEYIQREKDGVFADGTKIDQCIQEDSFVQEIIYRMNIGEIRLGSNKNRGFGRVKVLRVYYNRFTKENKQEYLDFLSKDRRPNLDIRTSEFEDKLHEIEAIYKESIDLNNVTTENGLLFTTINIPLTLNGGISIRKYSTKEGEPDYTHITCDNKPIIPGSSWNGAVRHRMKQILVELFLQINPNAKQKDALGFANGSIKEWFGYINEGKGDDDTSSGEGSVPVSNQSLIVFGESVIEGSQALTITRNKIDRFTAGTFSGALYTEKSYFGGNTTLSIMVRKDEKRNYKACIDALCLVLCDLSDGLLAVGGQVAVGRGVFSKNTDEKIEDIASKRFKHLYQYIKGDERDERGI